MRECVVKTSSEIPCLHVLFRVGKNHDPKGKEGLSHLLEHMMLRRDDNNRIMKVMKENYAIAFNAFTSDLVTDYFLRAPAEEKRPWKEFKRMLEEPVFSDYEEEKSVVIEEIRRRKDNPMKYCVERAMVLLLGERLGITPVGSEETVGKITEQDLERHYNQYYTRENLVTVTAGARLSPEYPSFRQGGKKPRDPRPRFRPGEHEEEKGFKQDRIVVLWPSRAGGADADPLRLYHRTLWLKNRLFTEIRVKRGWAYSVRSFLEASGGNHTILGVEGGVKKGEGRKAVRIARRIVEEFKPSERDLKKAKKTFYYDWLAEKENTERLAKDYAREIALRNRTPEERVESLMRLTGKDVLRAQETLEEPLVLVVS